MSEQFGPYRLDRLIERGGMGEVFEAFDTRRDRSVALKRLPDVVAGDTAFRRRFEREARIAARLSAPNVLPIHDYGTIDGRLYIDMRLVRGRSLAAVLAADGPLAPDRAVAVVAQVAGALDAAAEQELLHRDVTPSNILVEGPREDFAYLIDFGLGRSTDETGSTTLTGPDVVEGTFAYMAPERFRGERADRRADVYSLACVLYESLTGRPPFVGPAPALVRAHLETAPPRASEARPGLPPALDDVVARGMAKTAAERFPTAADLAGAARAALATPPPHTLPGDVRPVGAGRRTAPATREATPRRRRSVVALVLAAVVLLGGGAVWTATRDPGAGSPPPAAVAPAVTGRISAGPDPVAAVLSPDERRLYVSNYAGDSVSVIDTATGSVADTIATPEGPYGLALSPDGATLYVCSSGTDRVAVVDVATGRRLHLIDVEPFPTDVVVSADGSLLFVAGSKAFQVVDMARNAVVHTVPVSDDNPAMAAVGPDRGRVFVTPELGRLSVLDGATGALGPGPVTGGILPSPDGRRLYVTDFQGNTLLVLDPVTGKPVGTVPVGAGPMGMALSPTGDRLYVLNTRTDSVSVVDPTSLTVERTLTVGRGPVSVATSRDGRRLYVVGNEANAVSVIDLV